MDKDTRHLMNKIEFKNANNIDATEELLQFLYNMTENENSDEKLEKKFRELLDTYPMLSAKPDEASRQLYKIYKETYPAFKETLTKFTGNIDNEFIRKKIKFHFSLIKRIADELADKMLDFGEWEAEAKFTDIPEKPFLEANLSKRNDYSELLLSRLDLLEITNRHLEEALSENNKGKYMTTSTLLSGIMYDIAIVLRYMEE